MNDVFSSNTGRKWEEWENVNKCKEWKARTLQFASTGPTTSEWKNVTFSREAMDVVNIAKGKITMF